jgi:hypothetical protein
VRRAPSSRISSRHRSTPWPPTCRSTPRRSGCSRMPR